jgi:hypothetical protein
MMYAGPHEHATGPAEHLPFVKESTELMRQSRTLPHLPPAVQPPAMPPGLLRPLPATASARAHTVRADLLAGRSPAMHRAARIPTHTTIQPPPGPKRDPLQRLIDRLRGL